MENEGRLKAALADRYRIEQEIGSGGMATVYLAQDLRHERQVAVKVLNPELAQTLGAERFLREIKTAANLGHPHILPVFDSGEADGFLFYVMPYVKGESLRTRLTKEKQLPIEDAIQITREIADALAYAHEEGVVHRDVKPANIMLEAGHAVLADFGVAHAVATAKDERITRTGTSLGTPAYMSPEQATGEQALDGRSDQYALGCVLYEMLAGHPPFTGAQVETVVRKHLTEEPPSVDQARPSVAEEVARVINRALAKSPADRFRTAGEMAAALALTTTPVEKSPRPFSKAKALIAGVAGVAVVVVGAILLFRSDGNPSHTASGVPEGNAPTLAVLPCDNFSQNPEDSYLASGIHEEILLRLAKVSGMVSLGRKSVESYRDDSTPLPRIASELGVEFIGECSVRKDPQAERIRLTFQLLDARGIQVWAENFDRNLTAGDLFEIQSDIAHQVASNIGAVITPEERVLVDTPPTENSEAYVFFLRGRDYWTRPEYQESNWLIAQEMWEQAVELDPTFALARAKLSFLHGRMHFFSYDPSQERLDAQAREAAEALRLQPDLPEAQFAQAYVYYVAGNLRQALELFEIAQAGAPNDAVTAAFTGYTLRRLGLFDDWERTYHRALQLNPRDVDLYHNLGASTLISLHRFDEALEALNQALDLAPDLTTAKRKRARVYYLSTGQLNSFRAFLNEYGEERELNVAIDLAFYDRTPERVLDLLESYSDPIRTLQISMRPSALDKAWAYELQGDSARALAAYDSARVLLETLQRENPTDYRIHGALAFTYAGLGEQAAARESAGRYLEECNQCGGGEFHFSPQVKEGVAQALARAGLIDDALGLIEELLSGPSFLTTYALRVDPVWDPLRSHPRFQALLDEYGEDVER